jgi:hypothetical protein
MAATADADYQWLNSQLDRSQHPTTVIPTAKSKADLLAAALHGTTVVVSAAGAWQVDGLYTFHKVLNGAGVYRKTTKYDEELVDVWIYRCRMQNNSLRWFISIAPDNRDPGTDADTDFYYSTAGTNTAAAATGATAPITTGATIPTSLSAAEQDAFPPLIRWKALDRKYDPVPCLIISSSTAPDLRSRGGGVPAYDDGRSDDEDDESDHEDSMAVIDDEFPYINSSTPGTPIDLPPSP